MTSDGGIWIQPRATGGEVMAGSLNLVGDSGRELFIPDTHGTIIPNSQTERMLSGSGGGQSGGQFAGANVYIDATGADQAAIARLESGLRSLGASVQRMAVTGVREARRRGQTV